MRWRKIPYYNESWQNTSYFTEELPCGKCSKHKPIIYLKYVKNNLKTLDIDADVWKTLAENQSVWQKMSNIGCNTFEEKSVNHIII